MHDETEPRGRAHAAAELASGAEPTLVLLRKARQGDAAALEAFALRYSDRLRRWASGRLPPWARGEVDVEGTVRRALLETPSRIGAYEPLHERGLHSYLRQILLSRLRDELRRGRAGSPRSGMPDAEGDLEQTLLEEAAGSTGVQAYEWALAKILPEDREAIVARIEMGLTYEELADALGEASAAAAREAAARSLVRLAEEIAREG